jgi:hypothetical protein
MKRFVLIAVAVCLTLVLGLRLFFTFVPPPEPSLTETLADILPETLTGWQIVDHDMAESPEASARISEFLNFDDAIFRTYRRGDTIVGVYIAYWKPGKASYRWAGSHTPDTCWVINGWTRSDRQYSVPFEQLGRKFEPAEFGIYEKNGLAQNVYFWHLIGGKSNNYKQKRHSYYLNALKDIQKHGLNQRKEQFFIRLSSNKELEELSQLSGYQDIIESLDMLVLKEGTS